MKQEYETMYSLAANFEGECIPLVLESFKGLNCRAKALQLKWADADSSIGAKIEIQISLDGLNFSQVKTVEIDKSDNSSNCYFFDINVNAEYLRLIFSGGVSINGRLYLSIIYRRD
jgi:hypothetical protein